MNSHATTSISIDEYISDKKQEWLAFHPIYKLLYSV